MTWLDRPRQGDCRELMVAVCSADHLHGCNAIINGQYQQHSFLALNFGYIFFGNIDGCGECFRCNFEVLDTYCQSISLLICGSGVERAFEFSASYFNVLVAFENERRNPVSYVGDTLYFFFADELKFIGSFVCGFYRFFSFCECFVSVGIVRQKDRFGCAKALELCKKIFNISVNFCKFFGGFANTNETDGRLIFSRATILHEGVAKCCRRHYCSNNCCSRLYEIRVHANYSPIFCVCGILAREFDKNMALASVDASHVNVHPFWSAA
ncbi:hypothetical protein ACS0Y7_36365 [Burkholderia gladioli]|uniref:hypothetical protein n=1 Tax=Burkholderia gladioli TaxID=28095 RepID=UPI003F7991DC